MTPKRIYGDAYTVLVGPDREYTLVPDGSPVPRGWKVTGDGGTKDQCIKYIKEVWTDMRADDLERLLRM